MRGQVCLQSVGEYVLGPRPYLLIYQLAILEQQQGGDATHAKLGSHLGVCFNIKLADQDAARVVAGQLFTGVSSRQRTHHSAYKSTIN
jgi:hypothetical protein